jgi:NTP pyrophosphatase (non-canonical NTP hydrolase)
MNIIDYQNWTATTAVYPEAGENSERELVYLTLGLAGEAGEVADKIKKLIRSGVVSMEWKEYLNFSNAERLNILHEMGDTLWYLARLCSALDISLETLAKINHDKLEARKAADKLKEHE